jgi:NADH pyrophosphatase NudC (nudix superfamily)
MDPMNDSNNLKIVSVIAIIYFKDKFLLVRRDLNDDIFPGKYQNVGGKIETSETIEEALVREIIEETGIDVKQLIPTFVQSYSWKKTPNDPERLGLIFRFNLDKMPKIIKLCKELSQYGWFTIDEAKKLDTIGPDSPTGTLGQLERSGGVAKIK